MFDTAAATEARDAGAAQALAAESCQIELAQAITWAARHYEEITSDHALGYLQDLGIVSLQHLNAMGAAFLAAAAAGVIERTGRVVKSERVSAHRRNV